MTTLTSMPRFAARDPRRAPLLDRLRYTPAPGWDRGSRLRHVGYVGASMLVWTAVGLACSGLLAGLIGGVGA